MIAPEKRTALDRIIHLSEGLPALAKGAGEDFLAFLFEQALNEARAILIGSGYAPPSRAPASEEQSGSSVVPLRSPRKPQTPL
jgi:hypothetical protein